MDAEPEYHARHDVLEKARVFRLAPAGMVVDAGDGRATTLAYAEITQIRLRFFPTRVQTNRFECLVTGRGRELKFSNEFYQGIASFEDRSADYRRFVAALCRRVAAENPRAEFLTGRAAWVLMLEYGFLGLMALFLGGVLWLTGGALGWLLWVKLALIACFLPTLIRYLKRGRPARFDPTSIPEEVLPKVRA